MILKKYIPAKPILKTRETILKTRENLRREIFLFIVVVILHFN